MHACCQGEPVSSIASAVCVDVALEQRPPSRHHWRPGPPHQTHPRRGPVQPEHPVHQLGLKPAGRRHQDGRLESKRAKRSMVSRSNPGRATKSFLGVTPHLPHQSGSRHSESRALSLPFSTLISPSQLFTAVGLTQSCYSSVKSRDCLVSFGLQYRL